MSTLDQIDLDRRPLYDGAKGRLFERLYHSRMIDEQSVGHGAADRVAL